MTGKCIGHESSYVKTHAMSEGAPETGKSTLVSYFAH